MPMREERNRSRRERNQVWKFATDLRALQPYTRLARRRGGLLYGLRAWRMRFFSRAQAGGGGMSESKHKQGEWHNVGECIMDGNIEIICTDPGRSEEHTSELQS